MKTFHEYWFELDKPLKWGTGHEDVRTSYNSAKLYIQGIGKEGPMTQISVRCSDCALTLIMETSLSTNEEKDLLELINLKKEKRKYNPATHTTITFEGF